MTQTQIDRMAEATLKAEENYNPTGIMGQTIEAYYAGLPYRQAKFALAAMPEPIKNYKLEMGAVFRQHKNGSWVQVLGDESYMIWHTADCFGDPRWFNENELKPYFVQVPKEWNQVTK